MKDGHHTWPYSGEEHPVWMKHEEEPLDDYNKRMKEYITDLVKQEIVGLGEEKKRDYKKSMLNMVHPLRLKNTEQN